MLLGVVFESLKPLVILSLLSVCGSRCKFPAPATVSMLHYP